MNKLIFQPEDIFNLGKVFAESGLFQDAKDAAKAVVKIMAGQELGIPPITAMTGIHIVKGKVTLSAAIMATILQQSGKYTYKVVELNDQTCKIEYFNEDQSLGISEFTHNDAVKAKLSNKDTYKSYPRNMLYARAMSNGVRWFCPEVLGGPVYTPDEADETIIVESDQLKKFTEENDEIVIERVRFMAGMPASTVISTIKSEFGRVISESEVMEIWQG